MPTLIEQLPERIKQLEAQVGSENPYVQQLKEQLRASIATLGKSMAEVFRIQEFTFPVEGSSDSDSGDRDKKSK